MSFAFASLARHQRITQVSWGTGADWPIIAIFIGTRCAISKTSAWVRVAKVFSPKRLALVKRVSDVTFLTTADGSVVLSTTISIQATRLYARIDALYVVACQSVVAVFMLRTFRATLNVSVANEIFWTSAECLVILDIQKN